MKRIFLLALCCSAFSTFAQNGFFLQPEFGVGISNTKVKYPRDIVNYPWGMSWQVPVKNILSYNAQILIGYQFNHWSLTSGVSYLKTGLKEDSVEASGGGFSYYSYKETDYYYHIMLPVQIAYQFDIGDHFFFTPDIGVAFSYNYSSKIKREMYNYPYENIYNDHTLTNTEFNNNYKRTSFWGIAQIHFGYKLNQRMNIITGIEAQYMLTSILKNKNNYQRNHAYTFNAGITWNLRKNTKTETQSANLSK